MSERKPSTDAQAATAAPAAASATPGGNRLLWAFTLTTFLSAVLLFSVQPMFARMVLPVLGGSPSVWAVAMCFFQAALLAGYCYAHLLIAKLPARQTGYIHIALCLTAFLVLPIALPVWFGEPPPGEPYLWQLGLFAVAVGLPFMAVSANAPLLQAWFAATGDGNAKDPYFLYAASNLGSLIALLGYPLVLEPAFGVSQLSRIWAVGFVVLAAALALVFAMLRQTTGEAAAALPETTGTPSRADARPTWSQRLAWIGLALIPSALLTAFTTHVTTDVASAPLLWVLPLALYLLTFVLVFRERALISQPVLLAVHLITVVAALLVLSQTRHEGWFMTAPIGVLVFFTSAMVAHRSLYEARPAARYLTEFYLWMSFGGALGGLAAALAAPKIFSEVFEFPLLLALSMACRPGALALRRQKLDDWLVLWLILATGILAIYWMPWLLEYAPPFENPMEAFTESSRALWWLTWPVAKLKELWGWLHGWGGAAVTAALLTVMLSVNRRHPPRQLLAALMIVLAITKLPSQVKRGEAQRSYFGVYRVMLSPDGQFNTLVHGTTLHGAQRVRDAEGNPVADITPATYYHADSPMAATIGRVRVVAETQGRKARIGVIGLGTGSLACHSAEGETWRFFEIDPVVIGIAKSESFTFLENCQPNADIVIGDARLTMAKEADHSFDLIIVDAFSSDAVPVHLMTAEALKLYLAKVKPSGIALLHISNRYLDLDSVLAATQAAVTGIHGFLISDDTADGSYAQSTSTVAVFARSNDALDTLRKIPGIIEFPKPTMRAWTDDDSDILAPFVSMIRKRFFKLAGGVDTLTAPQH